MTRTLTAHKNTTPASEALTITVLDEAGQGGANHSYDIEGPGPLGPFCRVNFQNGPIKEAGVNGITEQALLAIVLDRLEGFQSGPFRCRENALAATKLEEAMHWLSHRTQRRVAAGVEGTNQPAPGDGPAK